MLDFNARPTVVDNAAPSKAPARLTHVDSPEVPLAGGSPAKFGNVGVLQIRQLVNTRNVCLTEEEKTHVLAIINQSTAIKSHAEFLWWLKGELQTFLPHQVMIAAWGNFQTWNLKLDVVSDIPGARTEWIARCERFATCKINSALAILSSRWLSEGRRPFLVRGSRELLSCATPCPLMKAMKPMRSILVHGIHDERGGYDSLYLLFSSTCIANGRSEARVADVSELLVPQIDIALRKVAPLPNAETTTSSGKRDGESMGLTMREKEIIDWIARGRINAEIAAKLRISTFTVKNHLRRIFKKLDAANRADAVIKYQRKRY